MRSSIRWIAVLGCGVVLAGSTGCVYWRLYGFRKQLSDFPDHCEIADEQGPLIRFKRPILKPGDVAWLTGLQPSMVEEGAPATQLIYELAKCYTAPEKDEAGRFDIRVVLTFEKGRLTEALFPPRYAELINEERLQHIFAPAERIEVERGERRTTWSMMQDTDLPSHQRLLDLAGEPCSQEDTPSEWILTYGYVTKGAADAAPDATPDAEGTLVFRKSDHKLDRADIQVGRLRITVKSNEAGRYQITMGRE